MVVCVIQNRDGSEAGFFDFDFRLISWETPFGLEDPIDPDGSEDDDALDRLDRLFMRSNLPHFSDPLIYGGVPVIFPQFGTWGPYQRHGFAQDLCWNHLYSPPENVMLVELRDDESTRAQWPYRFRLLQQTTLDDGELRLELTVENTGDQAFPFSAAFHPYLALDDIRDARVQGLEGARFQDWAEGGSRQDQTQQDEMLDFPGEVDRIFFGADDTLFLLAGRYSLEMRKEGFTDWVVWNPGEKKGQTIAGLKPGDWRKFVCVEAALIDPQVTLQPGDRWRGAQILHCIR